MDLDFSLTHREGVVKLNEDVYLNERQSWELYGYYVRAEIACDDPAVAKYFTCGLLYSRGKPDLQIREPLDSFMAVAILRELVERMDQGMDINPGQRLEDVVPGVVLEISESADEIDMLTISLSEASLAD
jgi:hypothetical protein